MKDRVHILLTAISLGVIALLVLLVSIPLVQNGAQHRGMETLVAATNNKVAAITSMRNALWQKTAGLQRMLLAGTTAERNTHYQRFNAASASYIASASQLASQGRNSGSVRAGEKYRSTSARSWLKAVNTSSNGRRNWPRYGSCEKMAGRYFR